MANILICERQPEPLQAGSELSIATTTTASWPVHRSDGLAKLLSRFGFVPAYSESVGEFTDGVQNYTW